MVRLNGAPASSVLPYRAAILVASDSRSSKQRKDETGPAATQCLADLGIETREVHVVPDDQQIIERALCRLAGQSDIALILTAGGTGLAPRDVTPEATLAVIERHIPGIPEMLRHQSMAVTPKSALSRGVAGILNQTLVINLPGSPKAVRETITYLAPILPHALQTVCGEVVECGRDSH